MLHDFTFRKPNKRAWSKGAVVGDEVSFEHIHSMAARMGVPGIDHPCGITDQANEDAGFRIGVEFLAEKSAANLFVETFFPGEGVSVDCDELAGVHGNVLSEF